MNIQIQYQMNKGVNKWNKTWIFIVKIVKTQRNSTQLNSTQSNSKATSLG